MREGSVPPNWADLVQNLSYSSTDERYDLSDTWFGSSTLSSDDPTSTPSPRASISSSLTSS